jgi:hypothetical protein
MPIPSFSFGPLNSIGYCHRWQNKRRDRGTDS